MASGPKGSSKDDSSFDYTPTANGDYTGTYTCCVLFIYYVFATIIFVCLEIDRAGDIDDHAAFE